MKREFQKLAEMIAGHDDVRPFAVTKKECELFIEEVGSDQLIPTIGAIVEIMGVECVVVSQIAHPNWTPDNTQVLK